MQILDHGRYAVGIVIEGHEFDFEIVGGKLICIREALPPGCTMAEDGHSPFYWRAKRYAGRSLGGRSRMRKEGNDQMGLNLGPH